MIRIELNLKTGPGYDRHFCTVALASVMVALLLLIIAGVVVLVARNDELQRLQGEIDTLDRQREAVRPATTEAALVRQQRQVAAINAVLERRGRQPWLTWLDELEHLVPEQATLTGVVPNSGDKRLVLQGRARGFGDLQRLLDSLSGATLFSDPILVSHTSGAPAEHSTLLQFTISVKPVSP